MSVIGLLLVIKQGQSNGTLKNEIGCVLIDAYELLTKTACFADCFWTVQVALHSATSKGFRQLEGDTLIPGEPFYYAVA